MRLRPLPGLGLRSLKTGIAVALCLLAARLLFLWEPLRAIYPTSVPLFSACAAAVICMQDTVENSWKHGILRLAGTGIGGLTGVAFIFFNRNEALEILLAFAGVVVTIFICNTLRIPKASAISCLVFCVILLSDGKTDPYLYALFRVMETAVGILISVAVNKTIPARRAGSGESEPPAGEAGMPETEAPETEKV